MADRPSHNPPPSPSQEEAVTPARAFGRLDTSTVGVIFFALFLLLARGDTETGILAADDFTIVGPFAAICALLLPKQRGRKIGLGVAALLCLAGLVAAISNNAPMGQIGLSADGLLLSLLLLAWVLAPHRLQARLAQGTFTTIAVVAMLGLAAWRLAPLATIPPQQASDARQRTPIIWYEQTGRAEVAPRQFAPTGDGLQRGDQLLAIDEIPLLFQLSRAREVHQNRATRIGQRTTYRVLRDGRELTLTYVAPGHPLSHWLAALVQLFAALFCLLLAGAVVWRRPLEGVAWLFGGLNLWLAEILVDAPLTMGALPWPPVLAFFWLFLVGTAYAFGTSFFLHFFLVFPAPKRVLRRQPAWLYLVYFPGVLACAARWSEMANLRPWGDATLSATLGAFWVLLGVVSMFHSYAVLPDVVSKRQIKVVFLAVMAIPPAVLVVASVLVAVTLFRQPPDFEELRYLTRMLWRLPVVILPAAFAYAIIRHRAMNLGRLVRQGLVYGAVLAVAVTGYYLLVVGVGRLLISLTGEISPVATMAGTLALAFVLRPVTVYTRRWVDRAFYRDRLETARRLRELTREMLSLLDRDTILVRLTRTLPNLFPAHGATLFLLDPASGAFRSVAPPEGSDPRGGPPGAAVEDPAPARPGAPHGGGLDGDESPVRPPAGGAWTISPRESLLLRALEQTERPVRTYDVDAPQTRAVLSAADRALVGELGAVLWLPLAGRGRLTGVLALGWKVSEEVYSEEELDALGLIAGEAAIALENAALSEEREHQARLQQEVAIGRSIQMRLLPPARLKLNGCEVISRSDPATEVGGDFYNLFEVGGSGGEGEWGGHTRSGSRGVGDGEGGDTGAGLRSGGPGGRADGPTIGGGSVDLSGSSAPRTPVLSHSPTLPLSHSAPAPRLGVLLGDVAGKGVPAALFMAVTTTLIEGQAQLLDSPGETLAATNARLYQKMRQPGGGSLFATAVYGVLDPVRGEARLASAGQTPPVHWPLGGEPHYLRLKGVPLGALAAPRYREETVRLAPGDRLLFLSDGFVEDCEAGGEMLGYDGFLRRLQELGNRGGAELVDALFAAASDAPDRDDRTLVLITIEKPSA